MALCFTKAPSAAQQTPGAGKFTPSSINKAPSFFVPCYCLRPLQLCSGKAHRPERKLGHTCAPCEPHIRQWAHDTPSMCQGRGTASESCCCISHEGIPDYSTQSSLLHGWYLRRSAAAGLLVGLTCLAVYVGLYTTDTLDRQVRSAILSAALMLLAWPVSILLDATFMHWLPTSFVRNGCCSRHAATWTAIGHGPLAVALWASAAMLTVHFALQPPRPSANLLLLFRGAACVLVLAGLGIVRRAIVRLSLQRVVQGAATEHLETLVYVHSTLTALFMRPGVPGPGGSMSLAEVLDMEASDQLRWAENLQLLVTAPKGMHSASAHRKSLWPLRKDRGLSRSSTSSLLTDGKGDKKHHKKRVILLGSRGQAVRAAKALFHSLYEACLSPAEGPKTAVAEAPTMEQLRPPPPPSSSSVRMRRSGAAHPDVPGTSSMADHADHHTARALELHHLEAILGQQEGGALMSRLDTSGDGSISLAEFSQGIGGMWDSFANAQATLAGRTTVSSAVSILVDAGIILVAIGAGFAVFQLDVSAVLLPLSAVLLAVSFAIGPSVSRLVASLTFVLAVQPFDVGDRVVMERVIDGSRLDVVAVGVMASEFRSVETGVMVTIGNDVLSTMPVQNLTRASSAMVRLPCKVPSTVTGAQIQALKAWLSEYCKEHATEWAQNPLVFVDSLQHGTDGTICLILRMRFLRSPAQSPRLATARTDLWVALSERFRDWGFHFARTPQPIRLKQSTQEEES